MKRLLFGLLLCAASTVSAQTDMTDRIINPGFEEEREGWEIHDMGCQKNDAFKMKVGKVYLENWTGAGGHVRDCRILQDIKKLPAGTYTVSCVAQNIQQNDEAATQTGVWVCANDAQTEVGKPGKYSVKTTVVDGTLTIGFKAVGATGNYVCVDDFHLTLEEPSEETYAVFRAEMQKLLQEAEELNQHVTSAEQTALDAAVADAQAVLAGDNTKDVGQVYITLRDAIYAYHFSLATPDNPLDVTGSVENPGFESSTKCWVNNGFSAQGNDAFPLKVGNNYLEKWGWNNSPIPDVDIHQDVTLPNGSYRMTAIAQNILQSNESAKQRGAYIYGNTAKTEVSKPGKYTVEFVVCDGIARIGAKSINCTGNYFCVDDIHLYYIGYDATVLFAEFNNMIKEGETVMQKHFHSTLKNALKKAIADAKAVTDAANMAPAANALRKAIDAAQPSIPEYAELLKNIEAAEKEYGDGSGNEADKFKAVIDNARALYTAATIDKEYMDVLAKELEHAALLYKAANGTGDVPTVITYNFVPEGATGALGRLKVKGMAASKILYKGFCWSKDTKEPTIADDYTTLAESVYQWGGIYVMEPLEPATVYYVRAFAMTKEGAVGYGEVRRIITKPMGQCTWSYAYNGEEEDNARLAAAAEGAMWYYNHWTNIKDYGITVNFDPGDASAHCSYGGWMTVGPNAGYQKIGTVMHESGHGVGQGQCGQWGSLRGNIKWVPDLQPDGSGIKGGGANGGEVPNKDYVIDGYDGWWKGTRSNMFVYFMTDGGDIANGDWAHCGPFGVNGAGADSGERLLYIGNALEVQGMGEDGMPPSGGSPTPYYCYESYDTLLYYFTSEDPTCGQTTMYLTETANGTLKYVKASAAEVTSDSTYAWHLLFQPQTCYYMIRNAKSGKYFTLKGSKFQTAEVATPGEKESFHLMPAQYFTYFGSGEQQRKFKAYHIMEGNRRKWDLLTLQAGKNGATSAVAQDIFNLTAYNQRWFILEADDVKAIANMQTSAGKEKLERYLAGAKEMLGVAHTDATEGVTAELTSVQSNIAGAFDELDTPEEVDNAITETLNAINAYLKGTNLGGNQAYDLTFLIEDAGMDRMDGWTISDTKPTLTDGVCVVTDTQFDIQQQLPVVPAGTYRLSVQAFQRPGALRTVAKDYVGGTDNTNVYMYLRTVSTKQKIKHIMADGQPTKLNIKGETVASSLYCPNTAAAAVGYFNAGLYQNDLVYNVLNGNKVLLGLRCTSKTDIENNWVVFDNFRLYYYGTEADLTGVEGVEAEVEDGSANVYDLSGRAVSDTNRKGIYIINGKKYVK